jgi:iron(II)-dependent oxidoreductase
VTLPEGFTVTAEGRIYCARDGAEMVLVPAGEFLMGNDGLRFARCWTVGEAPEHVVDLDAFLVDRHPVTVGQWRRYCKAAGIPPPGPGRETADDLMAIGDVTFDQTNAYADWAGKSLPTEAQWEKAARGTDGRVLPWGDGEREHPDRATPVGAFPLEASPYGVLDQQGGPCEWCLDYSAPYSPERYQVEPSGPQRGDQRALRGGYCSYSSESPRGIYVPGVLELPLYKLVRSGRNLVSSSFRNAAKEDAGNAFRCVRRLR